MSSLFLAGCSNKGADRSASLSKQAGTQDYVATAETLKKNRAKVYGNNSNLLYYMDVGLLYHYGAAYDSSILYLTRAVNTYDDLFAKSVTNEAASLLVNDNVRPYRARSYEMVWLHMFLAFDYLALGRQEGARIEMRQAEEFLKEVKRKAGNDPNAFRDDPTFRAFSALVYEAVGETDDAAISIYLAVKNLRQRKVPVPAGMAAYAWRLLNDEDRQNDIRELELQAPAIKPPRNQSGSVVVIGAFGSSPKLAETSFAGTWAPGGLLFYSYKDGSGKKVSETMAAPAISSSSAAFTGSTLHIKWAMPSVAEVKSQSSSLFVAVDSIGVIRGEPWGDTQVLLQQAMDEGRTTLLTRTVIRVVTRTIATEAVKAKTNTGNALLNLAKNAAADAMADQLEQADLRMWFLLPRTVNVARIRTGPGRFKMQVGVESADGRIIKTEVREADVKPGKTAFVFLNSLK